MDTDDKVVDILTLDAIKKRTSTSRWRSAYLVFWNEVVYQDGRVVSEFDLGSTLYSISQDADKAKMAARDRVSSSTRSDGIFRLPKHRGSASDVIQIPQDYYFKLISNGPEEREFTTIDQWVDYYNRRMEKLRYRVVEVRDGAVILGPTGNFIIDFPKNVSNPYLLVSTLNGHLDTIQRLTEELRDRK